METVTVWTQQNEKILETLERDGRYLARREFIKQGYEKADADIVLSVYEWLAGAVEKRMPKPEDAEFLVWCSLRQDATFLPNPGMAVLELKLPTEMLKLVNIAKWGAILNYSYIPKDDRDKREHQQMLSDYGVSDAKAYMTPFYPVIKQKIVASWERLFDDSIQLGNELCYGVMWEVKQEWVQEVARYSSTPSSPGR